jgi:hypothetical protein
MIISNDHKIIVLGPTKTGTRTIKNVLSPYGVFLEEHADYARVLYNCVKKVPDFDESKVEKYCVFWRDPVERFMSGVNHYRSPAYIKFLIRFNPEWFQGIDLSAYSDGSDPVPGAEVAPEVPQDVLDACIAAAAQIQPEQIFSNSRLFENNPVLRKQAFWYKDIPKDRLVVLRFADFETGLKDLAISFGAPADIQIPRMNESRKLTTTLSPALEAMVRDYYAEDYALVE